ncbi:RNA polymerase sigma factor [Brachybacterium sp. AOP43-C2-M15]|uniref:RNA polymerase sigma factor n=1 Tax=Brachybacterium sp. AOP43-C2-M15 TaxID=3457661 RepID=UPI0040333BFC
MTTVTPAPETSAEERALILRAQDGDTAAFEQLVDLHQGRLFRIAFMVVGDRQDAEDVVQEALVLAWRRLHLLEEPDAFRGWVAQICARRATDVVRRLARRATSAAADEDLEAGSDGSADRSQLYPNSSTATDPSTTALVNAQMAALARILRSIDPAQRTCWVLREIDGMSYREICRVVDASEPTVRGRIARARAQIVREMEEWR